MSRITRTPSRGAAARSGAYSALVSSLAARMSCCQRAPISLKRAVSHAGRMAPAANADTLGRPEGDGVDLEQPVGTRQRRDDDERRGRPCAAEETRPHRPELRQVA